MGHWSEQIEKCEGITGPDHTRCFEGIAPGMFGKTGEIAVSDVLGQEPGGVDVLFDGNGTQSGGCYVLVQVQACRWFVCDARLCKAQVAPSTAVRECADGVSAEGGRRCWFVLAVESGRTVSRMAERNCGGAAGRVI